ncbi:biopolymer transporter ExbD [candidate division KSB1 bacterium]|nr:biopolymer transporter ExbD [candidate division KSB1 bacterium]
MTDQPITKINIVKRPRRSGNITLKLTSMLDMFTIMLVFLLVNYDAEGNIISVTKDLTLPESSATLRPRVASVVGITRDWLLVDGRPVRRIQGITEAKELLIEELYDELMRLRTVTETIGGMGSGGHGFRGNISIQGDRDIEFDLLKRIMLTCGQAGYNNMNLTVRQK